MRRVLVSLLALAIGVPGAVYALGLGRLQQNSGLNEPFRGRIELLGADPEGVDDLKVDLADNAQFDRAGIPRPLELNKLAFEVVVDPDGRAYVQLTSRDPIREPYLNFLLELNWPQGRLVREYTALLDPPTYDPAARKAKPAPAPAAAAAAPAPAAPPVEAPAAESAPAAAAPAMGGDGTIGRATGPSDTLWSIATASRPDDSVSVQQMMLALLRANPEAFASDNINGLRQGYVLRIPDAAEINTLSRAEALEEVKRQHALWEELRGGIAASTPPEPVAAAPEPAPAPAPEEPAAEAPAPEAPAPAPEAPAEPAAEPAPAGDAAVKIVSAGEGAGAAETLAPADLEKMSLDELRSQLALAQESLTAQGAENSDLKSQVGESQELVDRLQRLVTLREQELAQLQQAIAERGEQPAGEGATEPAAETGAADVFEEPAAEAPAPAPTPAPAAAPAPAPAPAAKPAPAPAPVAAEPPPAPAGMLDGLVGSVVPKYVLDLVPGGALTILAVPVVGLLIAIAVVVLRRGGGERAPSSRAAAAAASGDDEDATVAAGLDSEDVTETPTDARGDESAAETEAPTIFQAPAQATAPTEDPLQELNIYLAYEQFDKAEELVRNAIRNEPDNLGYKVRLLEVYYSASNKRDYEATARDVFEATGGAGPDWNTTVAMWQELSPDRALFAAGGETEGALEATAAARQFVDITADAGGEVGADTVSFMPSGEATQPGPARAGAEPDSGGLDFDLGDTSTEEPGTLDVTGGANDAQDMFDISTGGLAAQDGGSDDILDLTAAAGADAGDQVFDLTQGADEPPAIEFDIGGEADDDILDVTAGGGATDVLDLTGGGAATPGEDLLDVTVTGDLGSIDQTELLNVTSPGTLSLDVGDEPAAAGGADDGEAEVLDITATSGGDEGGLIDFDFSGADTLTALPGEDAPAADAPAAAADDDLEFDITGLTVEAEEPPATHAGDPGEAGGGLEIDLSGEDFGLDDGGDTLNLPDAPASSSELEGLSITMGDGDDLALDTSGLSLELDDGGGADGAETLRMDLPADLSLDIGGDEDQTLVLPRAPGAEEPSDMDDAEQALSLATSYMEMGGGFEADVRENLQKVLAIGTPQQREEAQRLLDQL